MEVVSSIKYGTLDEDKIFAASRIPVGDDEQGLVEEILREFAAN